MLRQNGSRQNKSRQKSVLGGQNSLLGHFFYLLRKRAFFFKKDFIYCPCGHGTEEKEGKRENMKVRIEIDQDVGESEVLIRCARFNEEIQRLQGMIMDIGCSESKLVFYQGEKEFYLPIRQILFFETSENAVYAHTATEVFSTKYRLYELERLLPASFLRVSKSTILNVDEIYSITRNLTAASIAEFRGTQKKVYVSRNYYKQLKYRLEEKTV